MKVLITGAQFANKGAQSMLFNVIDQLRKNYHDVDVYFLTLDSSKITDENKYRFKTVYGIGLYQQYYESLWNKTYLVLYHSLRRILKNKLYLLKGTKQIKSLFKEADLLIDVSGYNLSSKWPISTNKTFINYFVEANNNNVPAIIMPQSFGPFDYGEKQKEMDSLIINALKNVKVIFAREQEGYDLLVKKYNLSNVRLSPDLVLQNKEIDILNIYKTKPKFKKIELETVNNNVCIIPNTQTVLHGNRHAIIELYLKIIDKLIDLGKNVYVFNHADDKALCIDIFNLVNDKRNVHLINEELNSIEYECFIKQFDYIICSRYHGIVHAYKQHIPAIILGWAIKYKELANRFGQIRYIFDITNNKVPYNEILNRIIDMNSHFTEESNSIEDVLTEIQANSCFSICWDMLKQK